MRPTTFISTLGTEPQVVTIGLYLLMQNGLMPARAIVLHTSDSLAPIAHAIRTLKSAFAEPPFNAVTLHLSPIERNGEVIRDITSQQEAEAVFRSIFSLIRREKQFGHRVHFCIAGGRKVMSVYGMAAAQLLFDDEDALYHLTSEGALLQEKRMVPRPGDKVQLVPVPILRWSADALVFTELMQHDDPLEAMLHGRERARRQSLERGRHFVESRLTPAERDVVRLVVREGLTNAEIGRRLSRSPKTVAHQLSSAYGKLSEFLGWPDDRQVDRHTLIAFLHDYLATDHIGK